MRDRREIITTLSRAALAALLIAAAVGVFLLLDHASQTSSEIREEAQEMLALTELQASLLHTNDLVAELVVDDETHGLAEENGEVAGHTPAGGEHGDGGSVAAPPTQDNDHGSLSDHPRLATSLGRVRQALAAVEVVVTDEPDLIASIQDRYEVYEQSIADLHRSEDAVDIMDTYHSGAQVFESAIRAEILEFQKDEALHLQTAVERSRTADLWMRTALPLLLLVAMLLGGLLVRSQSKQRRREIVALETANREKDDFVAGVSHELRTPITGVLGFLELLASSDPSASDRDEMVRIAAREALDLTNLVDDLLVIAKADAGGLAPAAGPVALGDQATQVLEGLDIVNVVGVEDDGTLAVGDAQRVRQIVRNLVTNALRYGGDQIDVRVRADGDAAILEIVDDGLGVAETDVHRIFQPYQRAHDAPGVPGSMGLGLTVSCRLANAMGGRLRYRRVDGRTVFGLELPLVGSDPPSAQAQTPQRALSRNR